MNRILTPTACLALLTTCMHVYAEPEILVERCEHNDADVVLAVKSGYVLCHFHGQFRDCADKPCFVRVRTEYEGRIHMSMKSVRPSETTESWSFYFRLPRFSADTTYTIEVGTEGVTQRNDRQYLDYVLAADGWKLQQDGSLQTGVQIVTPSRFLMVEGGSIRIVSEARASISELKYKLKPDLGGTQPVDGIRAARPYQQPIP